MTNGPIVVDGRVFATEAAERGMGRYVDHLIAALASLGHDVIVLVPPPFALARRWPGARVQTVMLDDDPLISTVEVNRCLRACAAALYIDATPFLPPMRYDVHVCPVVAILFDLIPLKFPNDYFPSFADGAFDVYVNGIARVQKADHVVAISECVKRDALRYLGIASDRCSVIVPAVDDRYVCLASNALGDEKLPAAGGITCIQGSHRSKNFPAAIPFLERLSAAASCDVDVIVPTAAQRGAIEGARAPASTRLHIVDSLSEERKFALQKNARVVAHLSLEEGYGIPLAEALCLYRPVVCLDIPINREIIGECADPLAAGILLLRDPRLGSDAELRAAAQFVRDGPRETYVAARRKIVERLVRAAADATNRLHAALAAAADQFHAWHEQAGVGVVAPTEIGTCGVSDYSLALLRGGSPRYAMVLGRAPRELELARSLRLLPIALLDDVRSRAPRLLFHLAVSDSLLRGFDAIAERSAPGDVLVVHDAGSYLPGLLMHAAADGDEHQLDERYLRDEPGRVRELSRQWLASPHHDSARSHGLFLEIDREFRSRWLAGFKGSVVSHHAAFAAEERGSGPLALLAKDSELLRRTHYVPMPIDHRANPGVARLADKYRWALGLARDDLLVCCAGSIVRGKSLDVVSGVVAALDGSGAPRHAGVARLMLAGRVLDATLFAAIRAAFSTSGRLVQIVELDETRYDALMLASDVFVAFREQRRIQMSHSYVRALALGRPIVTNEGAGFDDLDSALVCRDDYLAEDLERHLRALWQDRISRARFAASSQARYRTRHRVETFFDALPGHDDAVAAIEGH